MDDLTRSEQEARGRLQQLARDKRSSLAELSRVLGRNPAYLQQYVTRGSPRHLDEPDLQRIAEFLGISPRVIETRSLDRGSRRQDASAPTDKENFRDIPRLPLDASAGPGAIAAEEISYDAFRLSRRYLRELGLEGADLTAIRVEGDSMEPQLRSGDEIFVDRNKRTGEGIFVVRIGEAIHVKQVRASQAGRITLVSTNSAYAELDLPREDVEMIGRVVWKGGRI